MADYVSIANRVAIRIGEEEIRTPGDDNHFARTVAAVWDEVRQGCIREHTWNMAMARKGLTADAAVLAGDIYPWAYSFPLPADFLRLVEVLNLPGDRYQIEGRAILCDDLGPVYIRYLKDVPETALWDAGFVGYFAAELEKTVGVRISGSSYDVARGERNAMRMLSKAISADARENPPVEMDLTGWEGAYLGGEMPGAFPRPA